MRGLFSLNATLFIDIRVKRCLRGQMRRDMRIRACSFMIQRHVGMLLLGFLRGTRVERRCSDLKNVQRVKLMRRDAHI